MTSAYHSINSNIQMRPSARSDCVRWDFPAKRLWTSERVQPLPKSSSACAVGREKLALYHNIIVTSLYIKYYNGILLCGTWVE